MDYLTKNAEAALDKSNNAVVVEECIMQKGKPATAGSKILEGFTAPFDATVVEKLKNASITITGRTSMTEFGTDRLTSDKPETANGAVQSISTGSAAYALCNDVFGLIRRQAPGKRLTYIHPTYGTVSRYGLIPAVTSMDQIGVLCADLAKGFELLSIIAGNDKRDGAMFPEPAYSYAPYKGKIRLAIPDNAWSACEYAEEAISLLEHRFETIRFELTYFEQLKQVMYILSSAELCNNTNRYDGVKYGYRARDYTSVDDLYIKTRSEGFGRETKLAAIVSAMVLSREYYEPYYEKAMKIRRLIINAADFADYDIIALPSQRRGTPYEQSALYALAVLAGFPSISMQIGNHGIQLIAAAKHENVLFGAWEALKY